MRRFLVTLFIIAILLCAACPIQAQTVGGACSITGQATGIGNNPSYILVCNGSTWLLASQFNSNGEVGIGQSSPQAELDVNGGVRVGTDTNCTSSNAGELIYNSTNNLMEFCNGSAWQYFTQSGTPAIPTHSNGTISVAENTTVTVPGGATVTFVAWGGGGSGVGYGGNGGGGGAASITETVSSTTTFYLSVGGAGAMPIFAPCNGNYQIDGTSGGAGGTGLTNYSGGNGGYAGCYSSTDASAGGGGGGATTIWTGSYGGTLVLAAAGGGGGTGEDYAHLSSAAGYASGYAGGNGTQTSGTAGGTGGVASSTTTDNWGGGGGGGGGYATGGAGGTPYGGPSIPAVAAGGGANYAVSPGTTYANTAGSPAGMTTTPAYATYSNYPANAGVGGTGNTTGTTGVTSGNAGAIYYSW